MTAAVRLTPEAAADIEEAYRWYENAQPGLGDSFLDEIATALARVEENPRSYQIVHKATRRVLLRRFPYALFYFLGEEDSVIVSACFHGRRDPTSWQVRS